MARWRLAKSLEVLRSEVNALAPKRSKVSDGTIGDAAHASRNSDHNPYIKDRQGVGVVRAIDLTHDPAGGFDAGKLAEHVRLLGAKGDPRVRYVIFNSRYCSAKTGWAWARYSGPNAHKQHVHISVVEGVSYDSIAPWGWGTASTVPEEDDDMKELAQGATGGPVTVLQWRLQRLGYADVIADGNYGAKTAEAVKRFQTTHGYPATGAYDWLTADRMLDVLMAAGK
jgi:hypothetical protein